MLLKDLKKRTQSQRTAFLGALFLIGLIAVYNWIVAPHRNYLMAAQRYESALDNLAKRNQTIDNNLKIKKKEIKKLQENLDSKLELFFDSAEAGAFFSGIKAVTENAGCILCSLTFSSADSTSGTSLQGTNSYITAREAQLSVLGGYGNIEALMNKLQDGAKYVRISSVRINSDNENPGYLKCDMTVTIYEIQRKDNHRHG